MASQKYPERFTTEIRSAIADLEDAAERRRPGAGQRMRAKRLDEARDSAPVRVRFPQ